ncbi:MAG: hypothetical protein BMS9Abin17_0423 [Acidimicrobiia bacterium]|nr:MAG: hypothetical protein BMS9Abin17_0423 [Acidimicrobiia bacterium]
MTRGDLIGTIARLQVQRYPIKLKGEAYLHEGILQVERAAIDAWGMVGWHDDAWIIDTHHHAHPSRRGGGKRSLSVGFTGHYELMEERFGSAPIGIAGENIIVDGPPLSLSQMGEGLVIDSSAGIDVMLVRPRVAAPCVEFTSFMLGLDHVAPREEIQAPMADLHDGRRGFIVAADHTTKPAELRSGDKVYAMVDDV